MNLKKIFQPLVLISIGIIMNIFSAIVTHYFINQNNAEINSLNQKITAIETNIDSQWQAKTEMERKKEFTLLLLNNKINTPLDLTIEIYLIQHLNNLKTLYLADKSNIEKLTIASTIKITEESQQKLIRDINDQYLNKLEFESSVIPLSDYNAILYSIAIFMQLIGLILVLSRDLTRQ